MRSQPSDYGAAAAAYWSLPACCMLDLCVGLMSAPSLAHKHWCCHRCDVGAPSCRSHMAPAFSEFPFPEHLFLKFVNENNGGFASMLHTKCK